MGARGRGRKKERYKWQPAIHSVIIYIYSSCVSVVLHVGLAIYAGLNVYFGAGYVLWAASGLRMIKCALKEKVELEYSAWKLVSELQHYAKIDKYEKMMMSQGCWGYIFEQTLDDFKEKCFIELHSEKQKMRLSLCMRAKESFEWWQHQYKLGLVGMDDKTKRMLGFLM